VRRPDVAVVGGGSTGTSIAFHLAARGLSVELHERGTLASGPTGRSTAIVRQYYSHPLLVRMAVHGLGVFAHFDEAVGGTCGFARTGVLWAADEAGRPTLERNVRTALDEGADLELLSPDALAEVDPRITTDGIAVLCHEPTGGVCDPYLAAASYAEAAQRRGARVLEGSAVRALGDLAAGVVVVAAGPWSPGLLAPLGYELPIRPARAEVGRWRLPPGFGPSLPALADLSELDFYFKAGEPGFIEVGTLDPSHAGRPIDPDACPEGAEAETLDGFRRALERRLPSAAGGHWRGAWSGVYDVTPDWHPAIGPVPGSDRVYVAAGFSGHGFKLAPAVGVALAELVCDGASRGFDLAPLDPGRFARGELLDPVYGHSVVA
jgi:glycine/D-amino acid oxidase-like deaminating enzyme